MARRNLKPLRKVDSKLPPGNIGLSVNRNYAAYAEERFAECGYAGKSLLRNIVGAIRCKVPNGNSLLTGLVQTRQGVYAALLGRIMCGSSLSAASTAIGLSRGVIQQWLANGLADQQAGLDTYYSRFASDIHASLAIAVSSAEQAVALRNPLEYLRSGPGRAFYEREQYWQQPNPAMPPPDNDFNPLAVIDEGAENGSLSDNRMAQALDVLRSHGVLTAEYQKQLAEQAGIEHQREIVGEAEYSGLVENEGGPEAEVEVNTPRPGGSLADGSFHAH